MTRQEFEAHQARIATLLNPSEKMDKSSDADIRESDLHADILNECKRRGWIAFHGSMAHSTFRTPGEPDFVILADAALPFTSDPAKPRIFLIEVKTRVGKLSPDQLAIHAWAAKLGHTVHVVRSFAEFLEVVAKNPNTADRPAARL